MVQLVLQDPLRSNDVELDGDNDVCTKANDAEGGWAMHVDGQDEMVDDANAERGMRRRCEGYVHVYSGLLPPVHTPTSSPLMLPSSSSSRQFSTKAGSIRRALIPSTSTTITETAPECVISLTMGPIRLGNEMYIRFQSIPPPCALALSTLNVAPWLIQKGKGTRQAICHCTEVPPFPRIHTSNTSTFDDSYPFDTLRALKASPLRTPPFSSDDGSPL